MARRIPWKIIGISGAIIGGLGALTLATRKTILPSPKRVALIGDSYAVGLGPELQKLLPDFRFEGHVGNSSAAWASHAASCGSCGDWLTTFKPDVVLVALGVNDGATPNPANYQTIIRALHGIGARVVWIEPPSGVNTPAVRDVIESLGVTTVPATQTPLAGDRLHPIAYGPWAQEIVRAIT
jgi:hypothetical protein